MQNLTKDARITAVKEFFDSIKVIKLNAWEDHFVRRIAQRRHVELVWQRWRYHLGTFFNLLADQVPLLSLVGIFAFHTAVLGNRLDPATAFVVTNVYNRMRMAVSEIPLHVQELLNAHIALGRIVAFLNEKEIETQPTSDKEGVRVKGATLSWPSDDPEGVFTLRDVDLDVQPGLTLVSGPIGTGKTLLVSH